MPYKKQNLPRALIQRIVFEQKCNSMIFHSIIKTPFGEAAIIFRRQPFAIIKTISPRVKSKDLTALLQGKACKFKDLDEKARKVSALMIDYFALKPITPPWKWMDKNGLTQLQQAVLAATADIPFGQLKSYQGVAEAIGRPRAYRFVGTTLANNPFPILIPCHRVIRKNGSFGRFGAGADLKRKLIELEAGR